VGGGNEKDFEVWVLPTDTEANREPAKKRVAPVNTIQKEGWGKGERDEMNRGNQNSRRKEHVEPTGEGEAQKIGKRKIPSAHQQPDGVGHEHWGRRSVVINGDSGDVQSKMPSPSSRRGILGKEKWREGG